MLIFLWQQNDAAADVADFDCQGDSDCTFDGAEVVAENIVFSLTPPPRRRHKTSKQSIRVESGFASAGEADGLLMGATRAASAFDADGGTTAGIAGTSVSSGSFAAGGDTGASLQPVVMSVGSFVAVGEAETAASGAVRLAAALASDGETDASFEASQNEKLVARIQASARFDAAGDSDGEPSGAGRIRARLDSAGVSDSLLRAGSVSTASFQVTGDSGCAFAVGSRASGSLSSTGDSEVIITGLEHGTFEAAKRRVEEAFGRKLFTAEDVAPPPPPKPAAKAAPPQFVMQTRNLTPAQAKQVREALAMRKGMQPLIDALPGIIAEARRRKREGAG